MMSTLFIGPPDWVFRWDEHKSMFIGLLIGFLLTGVTVYFFMPIKASYEPVIMNEIKAKVLD